jgi:acyl-CoA thioester hydrolase
VSPFRWASRVYWEDTDAGGIVYYGNYLRFLERARTEWLRSLGFSQLKLAESPGVLFAVVSLNIEYRRPARLDDELLTTCEPAVEGSATIRFAQRIYRGADVEPTRDGPTKNDLIVEASVRVACIDARTLRPKRLPDFLTSALPVSGGARSNIEEPS